MLSRVAVYPDIHASAPRPGGGLAGPDVCATDRIVLTDDITAGPRRPGSSIGAAT